jgi:hypothetical protein
MQRENIAFTRRVRREGKEIAHTWLLRQNLLGQAITELNFQSPETVNTWYRQWADEFDARDLEPAFWNWRSRFASLVSWTGCGMPGSRCMVSCMKSASL